MPSLPSSEDKDTLSEHLLLSNLQHSGNGLSFSVVLPYLK